MLFRESYLGRHLLNIKRSIFSILLLIICISCSAPSPITTSTLTISPSLTASLTNTPTFTTTPTPSQTPTLTSTPTASPTPDLPISLGTQLPFVRESITSENIELIREIASFGNENLLDAVYSIDGKILSLATTRGIYIFDTIKRQIIQRYEVVIDPEAIYGSELSLSQDGHVLMAVTRNAIQVFDIGGDRIWFRDLLTSPTNPIVEFFSTLSPDGKLASISSCYYHDILCTLEIVDVINNHLIYTGGGRESSFSPDGKFLATISINTISLLDTKNWTITSEFTNYWEVAFSPKGAYVALFNRDYIDILEMDGFKKISRINLKSDYGFSQIIFSQNEEFLAVVKRMSDDVLRWNIVDGDSLEKVALNNIHGIIPIQLQDDGNIFQEYLTEFVNVPLDYFTQISFSNDEDQFSFSYISINNDSSVMETNIRTEKFCKITFTSGVACDQSNDKKGFLLDKESNILYWHEDSETQIFSLSRDLDGKELLTSFQTKDSFIYPLAISYDPDILLYSKNTMSGIQKVGVFKISDNKSIFEITANLIDYKFTGSGKYLALRVAETKGDAIYLFDLQEEKMIIRKFRPNSSYGIMSQALSVLPNDQAIVYAWDNNQNDRNYEYTLQFLSILNGKTSPGSNIDISPSLSAGHETYLYISSSNLYDGKIIIIGINNGDILCFDFSSGKLIYQWHAHSREITKIETSPDGKYLATSSKDGLIKLWGIYP